MGCPLAPGPAEGARDGRRAGRLGRRCARLLRTSPDGAADRSSADTGEPRRRVNDLPRQGPRAKISGGDK
jgi:hypothetical protein